ncbi:MBL fold metallo-hydrolase [Zhongshania sp.]|jgi:glyoxylase-like metal-dependent hydrolase (beta-lactamase superfamily II)|uniref:MBL fold metallo-hydrolase n=1 Tax=Zhongshania sp. TaxID=1971902 RepID=UPI002A80266A|nr:MBL fold metallo-hydrolase [Zhongshania sp.]
MMNVQHFFHEGTSTLSYVAHDDTTAIVIDPVRDYSASSGRTSWESCESIAEYLRNNHLRVPYVVDTHTHADHMTGLPYFKEHFGAETVTGARTGEVQDRFRDFYNLGPDFPIDGEQFDVLVEEGDRLEVGSFEIQSMHTPGHTPAHMSWLIGNCVFLGDTLFMPDYGSARCDFPGGSSDELFDSIQRLYALPEETQLYVCHDYRPGGRELAFQTTVAEQKRHNVQISERTTREEYVAFRTKKDATLPAPALILPSIQVNIRAGNLPPPQSNGRTYLSIPLNTLY